MGILASTMTKNVVDLQLVKEKLNSSLLSDVLDGMGIRNQCMN